MEYKCYFQLTFDIIKKKFKVINFEQNNPLNNLFIKNSLDAVNEYLKICDQKLFMFKSNLIVIEYDEMFVENGKKTGIGSSSCFCVSLITAILKIINVDITINVDAMNK